MSLEPTQEPLSGPDGPVASYEPVKPSLDTSAGELTAPALGSTSGFTLLIEFCDRCRWCARSFNAEADRLKRFDRLHRATWVQTELFTTFPSPASPNDEAGLSAITLMPCNKEETAGRWRVWLYSEGGKEPVLLWDRKTEGGFGELVRLHLLIRH